MYHFDGSIVPTVPAEGHPAKVLFLGPASRKSRKTGSPSKIDRSSQSIAMEPMRRYA